MFTFTANDRSHDPTGLRKILSPFIIAFIAFIIASAMGRNAAANIAVVSRRVSLRSSARLTALEPLPLPAASAKRSSASTAESEDQPVEKKTKKARVPKSAAAVDAKELPAHASRAREEAAWARKTFVVGCDEAGRGPLAGPVVAAACSLPADVDPIPGVGDSKTITDEAEREALYDKIVNTPGVVWSARVVSASRIDEVNILMASLEAMRLSVVDVLQQAQPKEALALIDGPFSPWKEGVKYADFQLPAPPPSVSLKVEPIKGGDAKVYCIAAASILAKVTRDRLMHALHTEWPQYGWSNNKGYPTAEHVAAIAKHGACAAHRRSFAPLKTKGLAPPTEAEMMHIEELCARAQP